MAKLFLFSNIHAIINQKCLKIISSLNNKEKQNGTEKHVPVIKVDGTTVTVTVGDVAHPMLDEHFIEWISLQTKSGNQRKQLAPGQEPVAVFELTANDAVESAYAYCNLHSLWKKDL